MGQKASAPHLQVRMVQKMLDGNRSNHVNEIAPNGAATDMQPPENKETVKCDNIVVSPRGIAESSGKKVVIFVPWADIERITLNYGKSDQRPIVSISLGVVFAIVGVVGLIEFALAPGGYRYELAMIAFGLIGASFINDALKQRYFLEVNSKKGARRLILTKHAEQIAVQEFCNKVRTIYKYEIADQVRR